MLFFFVFILTIVTSVILGFVIGCQYMKYNSLQKQIDELSEIIKERS